MMTIASLVPSADNINFTHFAPAERKSPDELSNDIRSVVADPLTTGLMNVANGLFAVLNDKRQVVAINNAFLDLVGISEPDQILGLRPGELVKCVHACKMPGGCGTSEYCSTCGAVISILSAQESWLPQERTCSLAIEKDNQAVDLFFNVRSCPVKIDATQFILFFMQDISLQQQRSCLERAFFHDINNILCALTIRSELLSSSVQPSSQKINDLHQLISRIAQEFSIQQTFRSSLDTTYSPIYTLLTVQDILDDVAKVFESHPATYGRTLKIDTVPAPILLTTDLHLTSRILVNMLTNAMEASPSGGTVTLTVIPNHNSISFKVWNAGAIPDDVSKRIFQRNFSTKGAMGRGLGTYSMKLFGEKILGGTVHFESTVAEGTTFVLTLATS